MKTDFLVIGSGIAGLNIALNAAKYGKVIVVTKDKIHESNTYYAQGGIAAVLDKQDSYDSHIRDTIKAGDGLNNMKAVQILVKDAPRQIKKLISLGVEFNHDPSGNIALTREGCHTYNRIAYSHDNTGKEIERCLVNKVKGNIKVLDKTAAIKLIVKGKKCFGAMLNNRKLVYSKATFLVTGGLGQLFENTSNPKIATGNGIALAYKAGAKVEDMEFVQFHPTLFACKEPFLISETLRGEGGILRDSRGKAFMKKYSKMKELAPRDVVARAILRELKYGKVYLDMTHIEACYLKKRFPYIYKRCLKHGIDFTKKPIPVCPGAHYSCGGVKTDLNGKTNIKGLYALGEVACTGVHGADRLGSNSMMEALVFGDRAVKSARKYVIGKRVIEFDVRVPKYDTSKQYKLIKQLQKLMCRRVGIIKSITSIKHALNVISEIEQKAKSTELKNMLLVAKLIAVSALQRKESRGVHYMKDFPEKNISWEKKHVVL